VLVDRAGETGWARPGRLTGWQQDGRSLLARFGAAAVSVTPLDPGVVRIRVARDGAFAARRSWDVARADAEYPACPYEVSEGTSALQLRTAELAVAVSDAGRVDVLDAEGRPLVVDGERGGPSWEANGSASRWVKSMPPGERYYGFGERTGPLDKRGRRYTCWTTDEWRHQGPTTDALYLPVPFFLRLDASGTACGLLLHNTHRTVFDLTDLDGETMRVEADGGELDAYVLNGPHPARVLRRLTDLVGRMPLPPRWALGYHQSRWGYASAEDVRAIAAELRSRQIPADAIHLDLDHMDGARVFTWNQERFADPEALVRDLREAGFRVVCIVGVGIERVPGGYHVYDEGRDRRAFLRCAHDEDAEEFTAYVWPGLCVFPDFARPDVRRWWGELYRPHVELGVAGFLNDMNEPAMHDRPYDEPGSDNTEPPKDLPHGTDGEPAVHAEVRNVYAYLENLAAYEALRRLAPEQRPFLLTRAGFAGVQRFAGAWTGDSSSVWEHLEGSLAQILNLGLSGVPFTGADIGGFFGDCGPELLLRWMQLGALTPLARNHSARDTTPQEPWAWGTDVEAGCRRAIELRYRLLPYLYTLFADAARTGLPVLRPLLLEFPGDTATHELGDEAMLGPSLLVAPVLHPGQRARGVYLPEGRWTDVRDGVIHRGPGWILAHARLSEDTPLFARGGSVVASGPDLQWTDERPLDPLVLDVYPGADGQAAGRLYEDDGSSPAHERGECCETRYACRTEGDTRIVSSEREGRYRPPPRRVRIRWHDEAATHERLLDHDADRWEERLP
jgi:alpha-glucosidase